MPQLPPETLSSFYLGAKYDIETKTITEQTINYDARDLTTHAVCVGMTGSGKTGLCISLLEEAAIDKVPALIIDPKGDMTNLLLQFSDLSPEQFGEWINEDDAARKGMTPTDFASATAEKWKKGLADWGQGTERIKMLKDSVKYTIFTPGSDSGVPVNIMGSFNAPGLDFDEHTETLRERIQGTVAALLGMIDFKDDPVRSREGILLATLFEHHWRLGENLDLGTIIRGIQKPPFTQLGVFDVDTFFPEKDRFQMAMDFNTLVASPQFSYWLKGEPLDIEKMYFTAEGKPRHSIFYIAHLTETERMFFVTLLLNSLITWMRRQSGTTSLRSLVYFDEIFGYFPPSANPPSKKPLLTILKQARAFGVGAVLVTQNPVDIDYKGLSNAGTWFIGKLQTERDKERVLDALKGAIAEAGGENKTDFNSLISQLGSRVFLLHNVHEDRPQTFHTRWAMSYLRGPLTRPQVKKLMKSAKEVPHAISMAADPAQSDNTRVAARPAPSVAPVANAMPPSVDPKIDARFFAVWKSPSEAASALGDTELSLVYEPEVLAVGQVRFYDTKRNIDNAKAINKLAQAPDSFGRVDWESAVVSENWERNLGGQPDHPEGIKVSYTPIAETMNSSKEMTKVEKDFSDWLYRNEKMVSLEHTALKLAQSSDESPEAFQMRLQQEAREKRDKELDELQDKYEDKLKVLEKKIRKEEHDLDAAEADLADRKKSELLGAAETLFSMFVKGRSRSLGSAATKNRMKRKAKMKAAEAAEDLEDMQESYEDMEKELKDKLKEVSEKWEDVLGGVTKKEVKPRRSDVVVDRVMLAWHPYWVSSRGDKISAVE